MHAQVEMVEEATSTPAENTPSCQLYGQTFRTFILHRAALTWWRWEQPRRPPISPHAEDQCRQDLADVSHAPSYIYLLCSCIYLHLPPALPHMYNCKDAFTHARMHTCMHRHTYTHARTHINSLHTGRYTGLNSSSVLIYTERSFPDVLVHNPCAPSPQVLHIVHLLHTFVTFITLCVLSALCTVVYCCQSPTCIYTLVSVTILCAFCALCSIANWYIEHSAYSP